MLPELWLVVSEVVQVLENLGINYYIGGSVASGWYGIPRLTRDVDFIADLSEEKAGAFVAALQTDFYVDDWAVRRSSFTTQFQSHSLRDGLESRCFHPAERPLGE